LAALCAVHPSFKDVFEPFLYKQGLAICSESLICSELDKNPAVWAMKNLLFVLARFISYGLDPKTPVNIGEKWTTGTTHEIVNCFHLSVIIATNFPAVLNPMWVQQSQDFSWNTE
jgi:hypothetical protein